MNAKAKLKIVLDVAMTLALLFLMGYPWWAMSPTNGRARGCSHCSSPHILNAGWWRSLGKGRYTPAGCFSWSSICWCCRRCWG